MKKSGSSNPNRYDTEKLTFAAYLTATGKAELVDTKPIAGSRTVTFVLSPSPSNEDIARFFNGSATVSALRFSESLNRLKSVAYEVRRNNGELR